MQHLNDDMDDLFRKAADEYPLNTGVPDWNRFSVANASASGNGAEAGATAVTTGASKKNYRRFLWFLLLLPVMFVCNYVFDGNNIVEKEGADKNGLSSKNDRQASNKNEPADLVAGMDPVTDKFETAAGKTIGKQPGDVLSNEPAGLPANNNANKTLSVVEKFAGGKSVSKKQRQGELLPGVASKSPATKNNFPGDENKHGGSTGSAGGSDNKIADNENIRSSPDQVLNASGKTRRKTRAKNNDYYSQASFETSGITAVSPEPFDRFGYVSNIEKPVVKGASSIQDSLFNSVNSNSAAAPVAKLNTKKFYVGGFGGLDLSTVQFQKFSKIGWHYGGIAGYQFAKKWSIELGFFVDKKYYYTTGEYFSKGGLNLPSTSEVLWVDGDCLMYEIPVGVKYDIRNTYKSNWFVTGGFTSYFMKKENYDMLYLYTNSGSTAIHKYEYKNSSSNYFSEVRLSAGYSYKMLRNLSLRVEPYLNVPVSGVGYGKLKLYSGGLNVGVVKRF